MGFIRGIQLSVRKRLPLPYGSCTVTADDAPAKAEQECQLSQAQIYDVPRLKDAYVRFRYQCRAKDSPGSDKWSILVSVPMWLFNFLP